MVRALAPLFVLVVLVLGGCRSSALGDRDAAFAEYFPLMSEEQRVDFAALRRADERVDYIRQQGLDIELMLSQKLRRGMSTEQVETILGSPRFVEGHRTRVGPGAGEYLTYIYESREGVAGVISYAVRFEGGDVTDWNAWPDS